MIIPERVAAIIFDHGETMVLTRTGEATTVTLKGKRLASSTVELEGGTAAQDHFPVLIAPTEIAASDWVVKEPQRKDSLIVDGRTRRVLNVDPKKDGDTVLLYLLDVIG